MTGKHETMRDSSFKNDLRLFYISVILLFLELLVIRWLSAELRIFAYFHNLVLIICFLGIGLGCAGSQRRSSFLTPLFILAFLVFFIYCPIDLGIFSLREITDYLGNLKDFVIWYQVSSSGLKRVWEIVFGVGMLSLLTAGIVYLFIPFGQLLGQLLSESQRPIRAYTINILGSLVGIVLFTVLSFFSSPPVVWFGLFFIFVIILLFWEQKQKLLVPSAVIITITMGLLFLNRSAGVWDEEGERFHGAFLRLAQKKDIWSPYQKLEVVPLEAPGNPSAKIGCVIYVNGVPYQQAINLSDEFVEANPNLYNIRDLDLLKFDHYNLPYLFSDRLEDVLIVGAGVGNDVAGALRNGALRIDAVEIDKEIIRIGKDMHPEQPYSSDRVNIIIDDARSFFHRTQKRYDLVVFGLLDSHTLSSNLCNVRLDNFVYTLESIEEARRLLKPGGTLVLVFAVVDRFIGENLYAITSRAFEQSPLCFKLLPTLRGWGGSVFVNGDANTIRNAVLHHPFLHTLIDKSFGESNTPKKIPTDDWPYLYLSGPKIPSLYYIIFGLLMLISLVLVRRNFSGSKGMDWHFFFLGAGFLLIEVQNVSKLALLFGTTWIVNSIIIAAVLIMILLANYYVSRFAIRSFLPYYGWLALALLVIYFYPLGHLARFPFLSKAAISGVLLSLPVFFSGIIFAHSFSRSKQLDRCFASNLIGAMLGGMLECVSFVSGIKSLILLALVLYALSYATLGQKKAL
ncbi:MAG: hypothetical protein C4532_05640 [Candidatus Abyssobacteria bacterium SURF_17]|uniref:Methyltransferase domain-containing protein n=1 Tax=Candidatus Abyssobacteria bacterium SURF_17 TaxID=2093361 RepID=A0A419F2Q4_9BACT|nr:MAG: hypothetical protein C4532_05640 [Candidatus Abyssubacteria bacterium SURF_17]